MSKIYVVNLFLHMFPLDFLNLCHIVVSSILLFNRHSCTVMFSVYSSLSLLYILIHCFAVIPSRPLRSLIGSHFLSAYHVSQLRPSCLEGQNCLPCFSISYCFPAFFSVNIIFHHTVTKLASFHSSNNNTES